MKLLKPMLVAAILLSVSACSTVQSINSDFTFDPSKKNGLVVVSITQDSDDGFGVASSIAHIRSVTQKDIAYSLETRQSTLIGYKNSDFVGVQGHLYAFEVPEGTYQLKSWTISRGVSYFISPKIDPPALDFSIKANEITYIGNIHMNLILGENMLGMTLTAGGIPEIKDELKRDLPIFRLRHTKLGNMKIINNILMLGSWTSGAEVNTEMNTLPPINTK